MSGSDQEAIRELVLETRFQDTHEHLPTERSRIIHKENGLLDFSYLFTHYIDSDLISAGLSEEMFQKFTTNELEHQEKWQIVEPQLNSIKHTGYGRCLRQSISTLFDIHELTSGSMKELTSQLNNHVQHGFYERILRGVGRIDHVQVNCLESQVIRIEDEDKSLISQDLNTLRIASQWDLRVIEEQSGNVVSSIYSIQDAISKLFEKHGSQAIAVKDPCAYWRSLRFEDVSDDEADSIVKRFLVDEKSISKQEYEAVGSNLFRHAVREATKRQIPIKIHTGYLAGANHMNFSNVRENITDLQLLIKDFPDARFVLMHITYPFQNELLALAKHYSNVYVDMCWSWIIDPLAASHFLSQFLVTVPSNKIFTFGGDFIPVELVIGHAEIARHGIVRSLSALCDEGLLNRDEAIALVPQLMNGNAKDIFKIPNTG